MCTLFGQAPHIDCQEESIDSKVANVSMLNIDTHMFVGESVIHLRLSQHPQSFAFIEVSLDGAEALPKLSPRCRRPPCRASSSFAIGLDRDRWSSYLYRLVRLNFSLMKTVHDPRGSGQNEVN